MKIGLAQINPTVGDLPGNFEKILAAYQQAVEAGAELVLTPELAVPGYPPLDLVFKSRFVPANLEIMGRLQAAVGDVPLVVGFVAKQEQGQTGQYFHNAAAVLQRGRPPQIIYKSLLPTYDVFDEARYFNPAARTTPVEIHGRKIGLTICEDIWAEPYLPRPLYAADPPKSLVEQGAEMILNISASPFQCGKPRRRFEMIGHLAKTLGVPVVYCNAVGGDDQLVFDGHSCAFNARGETLKTLPGFAESITVVDTAGPPVPLPPLPEEPAELHPALVLGLRDYFLKCGFKSAVLGLSGGIDSAVVAALAVEALGAENVTGVAMPSAHSSKGQRGGRPRTRRKPRHQMPANAHRGTFRHLQAPVRYGVLRFARRRHRGKHAGPSARHDPHGAFQQVRLPAPHHRQQERTRRGLLHALRRHGRRPRGHQRCAQDQRLPLGPLHQPRPGKSSRSPPSKKPPSAELKPGQVDQDTLPPYDLLDRVLQLYVEENLSAVEIIGKGYDAPTVRWIQRRVDLNEYKRAQAVPGLKVTSRAFGSGRRMAHRATLCGMTCLF